MIVWSCATKKISADLENVGRGNNLQKSFS